MLQELRRPTDLPTCTLAGVLHSRVIFSLRPRHCSRCCTFIFLNALVRVGPYFLSFSHEELNAPHETCFRRSAFVESGKHSHALVLNKHTCRYQYHSNRYTNSCSLEELNRSEIIALGDKTMQPLPWDESWHGPLHVRSLRQ